MSGPHYFCRPCDAWYRQAPGMACPECGAELERRTFHYPEDVFGPPTEEDDTPLVRKSRRLLDQQQREKGNQGKGLGILFIGHLVLAALASISQDAGMAVLFIGITQLVYAIPMMIIYGSRGENRTVSGLSLGMGLTFMLNATCFGVVCGTM